MKEFRIKDIKNIASPQGSNTFHVIKDGICTNTEKEQLLRPMILCDQS